jgi:diadenosine tetraphosphate (Ap4A) HIT family hydrolase
VAEVRTKLQSEFRPEGFNIGVNDGRAAGQTVAHAHIHIIPRYSGDVADPRGGVRWVIAEKAKYW